MHAFHRPVAPPTLARLRHKRLPRAVKQALLAWLLLPVMPSAQTADYGKVEVTGSYWTDPYYPLALTGSHIELPNTRLGLTAGTINAASGLLSPAILELGSLYVGSGNGWGKVFLDDHSILRLSGDDARLSIGENGDGYMRVSNGALLDATASPASICSSWCGTLIGATAGSTGVLLLTDRDTVGKLTDFEIGNSHLGPDYGTPGGTTHATLNVLNGATLYSDNGRVASYFTTPQSLGSESVYGNVTVNGAGSAWHIGGLHGVPAMLDGATHANTHAAITIGPGALLTIAGQDAASGLNLGMNGGQADMLVTGSGAAVQLAAGGFVNIGANGGNASLSVSNGASFTGGREIRIGTDGAMGTLGVGGAGASVRFDNDSNLHLGASHGNGTLLMAEGGQFSVANLWAGEGGGSAYISVDGAGSRYTSLFPAGPGNDIQLGNSGFASLSVTNGGSVTARGISMGAEPVPGNRGGNAYVSVAGPGSTITLDATQWHRLGLENGTLTVSGGGLFDAGGGQAACWASWCGAFIGVNAGADANVTVTGAGSRAAFASNFQIGAANAGRTPVETYNYGVAGGTTYARVSVLDGGRLETTGVVAGIGATGSATLGSERVEVALEIIGKNSVWAVTGIPGASSAASFRTGMPRVAGSGDNVNVDLRILQGGKLQLGQAGQTFSTMQLGVSSGRTTAVVSGAGSALEFLATENLLVVGQNQAYASLSFTQGAQLNGATIVQVGTAGAQGELRLDAASANLANASSVIIGSRSGNGSLLLTHGSVMQIGDDSQSAFLTVGFGNSTAVDTQGTLRLDGGSSLRLSSRASDYLNADGSYNYNPYASIGYNGNGTLSIRGGSALVMQGWIAARPDDAGATTLMVGQNSANHPAGGNGVVQVSGNGSLLEVSGHDAAIYAGASAAGLGQIAVQDGASLRTTLLQAGSNGGSGSLTVDRASVALSGQFDGGAIGAGLTLGLGNNSFGTANLMRGSTLTITNPGGGAGLLVGSQGGTGVFNASGGSQIGIAGAPGLGYVKVGMDAGSNGIVNLNNAGLDVGRGQVLLAGGAGGNASLALSNHASLQADYVGVGSTAQGDGGSARLIVNDSTLTANVLEIGGLGYVGGNGVLQASIINRGMISPGNSPGTLTVDGSFVNASGGKLLLEVGADGSGGYVTDHLLFMAGNSLKLGGLAVTFHFLGAADPTAFLASGAFNIDQFIGLQGGGALDHALFGGLSYAARADGYVFSNFQFSADGGASFTAAPVPEPSSWLMMLGGLAALSLAAGRGRRAISAPGLA